MRRVKARFALILAASGAIAGVASASAAGCASGARQGTTRSLGTGAIGSRLVDPAVSITLVESAPVETTLDHAGVPNAADVWVTMIDGAKRTIDFAEFYASEIEASDVALHGKSALAPVLVAIERAIARGVRVRFLADSIFAPKYPSTLERLRGMGVAVRIIKFGDRAGGVLHAKYFVVDSGDAFVGSQNFDWRALSHIQEMGVRVRSTHVAESLLDIFDTDWELAKDAPADTRVRRRPFASHEVTVRAASGEKLTLVGSPKGWLPDESSWDLPKLVQMIEGSKTAVDVQLLTYKTTDRDGGPFPTLDQALRRAASRHVRVRLLVSEWSAKPGSDARKTVDELARVPGVEVRVIAIPKWSGGDIPFARIAHAKYMVVDPRDPTAGQAWVGTSNWEGDYFTKSRNVGVIAEGGALPSTLEKVFEDGWSGAYATPLASYPDVSGPRDAGPGGDAAPPSSSGPARP